MRRILNWSARRSSAHLTITGKTTDGELIRVTHVEEIRGALPWPIAVDVDGREWELACDASAERPANVPADTANLQAA